jgi:hypothetical protein
MAESLKPVTLREIRGRYPEPLPALQDFLDFARDTDRIQEFESGVPMNEGPGSRGFILTRPSIRMAITVTAWRGGCF